MDRNTPLTVRASSSLAGGRRLLLDHLEALAAIEDGEVQAQLLQDLVRDYVRLEQRLDGLLKNTLPPTVAEEIKHRGRFAPRAVECTILFTDLVHFTQLAERLPADELVQILHRLFAGFDALTEQHGGTKIKTIGDAYMAAFGAPLPLEGHAERGIACGLQMVGQVADLARDTGADLQLRVGLHSGRVTAGVVGVERMQFDVFGDDVNIAARFEAAGEPGRVNISNETRRLAGDAFDYQERGEIPLKNKAPMRAYFVTRDRGGR